MLGTESGGGIEKARPGQARSDLSAGWTQVLVLMLEIEWNCTIEW